MPHRAESLVTILMLGLLAAIALYQFTTLRSLAIDDAYISYRYAANLAQGEGLVFNSGERVQGFTNPFYTLLLALGGLLGLDIPRVATMLGLAGALLTVAILLLLDRGIVWRLSAGLAGIVLLLTPAFILNALSGMETMVFCALLAGVFYAFLHGRGVLLGVFLAFLLMTRPDGVLWAAPLVAVLFVIERRSAGRALMLAAALYGAWLLFAWVYYGSPVPQSVLAKRLIHPAPFDLVLSRYGEFLRRGWTLHIAQYFALAGLAASLLKRQREVVLGLAAALYVLGMSASQVMPLEVPRPFFWYAVPVILVMLYFAARGVTIVVSGLTARWRGWVSGVVAVALFVPLLAPALRAHLHLHGAEIRAIRSHFSMREALYEETARCIREHARGRAVRVLVGEVGVLGYHLLGIHVDDSSSINSPLVYGYRLRDREAHVRPDADLRTLWEGTPEWVLAFLEAEKPDFVTTLRPYLHINVLEREPRFTSLYEPCARETVWQGTNTLFALRTR
ncbi:MAG: hypothetical protein AB1486_25705 [Planctomycetota bacterium]